MGSADEQDEEDGENATEDGVLADDCATVNSNTTEEDTDDEGLAAVVVSAPSVFATEPLAVVAGVQDAGCAPPCPAGWDSVAAAHVNEGATDDGPATAVGSTRTRRRAEVGVCKKEKPSRSQRYAASCLRHGPDSMAEIPTIIVPSAPIKIRVSRSTTAAPLATADNEPPPFDRPLGCLCDGCSLKKTTGSKPVCVLSDKFYACSSLPKLRIYLLHDEIFELPPLLAEGLRESSNYINGDQCHRIEPNP